MSRWTTAEMPDQHGRTFLVTGGNSGLGLATATALARAGADVVLACRDAEKAERARRGILAEHPAAQVGVHALDLADLDAVRASAEALGGRRIDVLINNAGVMAVPQSLSAQGHELHLATNVLGPFLLTALLFGQVTDRVVWLSSAMHRAGRIALEDLDFRRRSYNRWAAYSQSKLADLMLAYEMQRRLTLACSTRRSVAAHPGYSATNLTSHTGNARVTQLAPRVDRVVGQTATMGALPTLFAATVKDLPGGAYIGPDGPMQLRGYPRPVGSSKASHDRRVASRLWARCEDLVGAELRVD